MWPQFPNPFAIVYKIIFKNPIFRPWAMILFSTFLILYGLILLKEAESDQDKNQLQGYIFRKHCSTVVDKSGDVPDLLES